MGDWKSINGKWIPASAFQKAEPVPEAPKEEVKEVVKEEPRKESRRRIKPIISE